MGIAGFFLFFYGLKFFHIFPTSFYTNEDFDIPTYISAWDQDQDGYDDQTDILLSARSYLDQKPKYQSKYYAGGYPDDGYGVCTDVVAAAFLGAGYDLRERVHQDILARPEDYSIEIVDPNIDYRRVRNLNVYFSAHAISLTTDVSAIAEWQGGDIVVFPEHIGIVSDRRNRRGIPLVLHHAHPFQVHYEEDILEQRDVIAHYRFH